MAKIKTILVSFVFLFAAMYAFYTAMANHHEEYEHGGKGHHNEERNKHYDHGRKHMLNALTNSEYVENCGTCHFAYQPELLPSRSWEKILSGLQDHFGEVIELDPETVKTISDYLEANSADHSAANLATKILRSLGNQAPLRITEVPCIRREHHEIQNSVLNRESVGSLSNCVACHTTAEKGIYDDDNVRIPR